MTALVTRVRSTAPKEGEPVNANRSFADTTKQHSNFLTVGCSQGVPSKFITYPMFLEDAKTVTLSPNDMVRQKFYAFSQD